MKIFNWLKKFIIADQIPMSLVITDGRQTNPNTYKVYSSVIGRQYQEYHNKDLTDLSNWTHNNILSILRSVSPEASQAISMYLRIFDSGYSIDVKKQNGSVHEKGKEVLFELINKMESISLEGFSLPNDLRTLSLKFALDALVKGAIAGELAIDKDIQVTRIHYVDPWSIEFALEDNRYVPFQNADGEKVRLDIPNFFYIPVDPLGNDPYGEEQITAAIQPIIFKCMVMQDLRMAIHTNGWRKLDFQILEEAVLKNIPPKERSDPVKINSYFTKTINEIIDRYKSLNPDDNIVHTDSVQVKALEVAKGGMFDPKPLLDVIDNQIANALKTFQIILSKKFGGGSEGFSAAEMILYIKLVGSYQKIVESLMERAFVFALRMMGILAVVDMKFNKPELRTDMELSQWKSMEIDNLIAMFEEQAIGNNEKVQRMREIGGFNAPVPDDLAPERTVSNGNPNAPKVERPTDKEADKERKRKESNRSRRSGKNKETVDEKQNEMFLE